MTQFTLAVTQAPHASYYNGGTAATARQYWLRPTQHTPPGSAIDAIVAGMVTNEVRKIDDANGGIFTSRSPDNGGTYSTLDWTPKSVWHAGTQQLIHGGMRQIDKISIYSDTTGEWREEAMPRAMAGYQQFGHWYDRTALENDTVWLQGYPYDPYAGTFGPAWLDKPSIGANAGIATYSWFPEAGSAGAIFVHGGDARKIQLYDPALQTWSAAFGPTGNGLHAVSCYHPAHGKVLLAGGSSTSKVVNLVSPDGSFVRVADCPVDVSMSGGADSNMLAHSSGCWLLTGTTPAPRRLYAYWPDSDTWTEEGNAPDNGGDKYPSYSWDPDRELFYFVDITGLYAWKPLTITHPGSASGISTSLSLDDASDLLSLSVSSVGAFALADAGDSLVLVARQTAALSLVEGGDAIALTAAASVRAALLFDDAPDAIEIVAATATRAPLAFSDASDIVVLHRAARIPAAARLHRVIPLDRLHTVPSRDRTIRG